MNVRRRSTHLFEHRGVSQSLAKRTHLVRRDAVNALQRHGDVPSPGETCLLAFGQQVVEHAAEPWPIGDGEKLSRDLVIWLAGQLAAFAGKLGMMTCDQVAGCLEDLVIEIGLLGVLYSIDQSIEIVLFDRFRGRARVLYMRWLASA